MTSLGEVLRRERLRRNLEVGTIAGELKISARFLAAIEAEDFAKLPGGVFTKSFIRQYAAFLGLDAEELASQAQPTLEPPVEVTPPAYDPKPNVPRIPLELGEDWRSVGEHRSSMPSWITAGLTLLALMVVCSGVYWWWERPRHPVLARGVPPAQRVAPPPPPASPTAHPPDNPPPATSAAASTKSETPPVATTAAIPVSAPNPNASVRVALTADEPAWIQVEVNGKYQFSGTLAAHESRNIDADGPVQIKLGNAGGVTLTWNGKPVGPVGPKGQIRTVQFTSGGFQIVSSKPADPLDRL